MVQDEVDNVFVRNVLSGPPSLSRAPSFSNLALAPACATWRILAQPCFAYCANKISRVFS